MKILVIMIMGFVLLFSSIDINNATKKELMSLKGVGVKKAEAIVSYRKIECFKNLEDIVKVKGIGQKFMKKNKTNLKLGICKK